MMGRTIGALALALTTAVIGVAAATAPQTPPATSKSGWEIPPEAQTMKNPLAVDAKLVASGKALFKDKCQKCHGPQGKGDGPDGDPDAAEDMDLTNAKRAARNTDGVVFYKAWNGRRKPKMPAVKEDMTKEQLWAVVAYVQTLRKTATE